MTRRKKVIDISPSPKGEVDPPRKKRSRAEVELRMKGPAEEVKREMADLSSGGNGKEEQTEEESLASVGVAKERRFNELMQEARCTIVVQRTSPRTFPDPQTGESRDCAIEVFRGQGPLYLEDVKQEIFGSCGGWKYRVAVHGPDGVVIDAIQIENPNTRDPILQPLQIDTGEDPFAVPIDEDVLDKRKKSLEKRLDILNKEDEIRTLEEQLQDIKERRVGGRPATGDDAKINAIERKLIELQASKDRDALLTKIDSLERQINLRPAVDPEKEELKRRLQELERKGTDENQNKLLLMLMEKMDSRFNKLLELVQNQQQSVLVQKLDAALQSRGGGGGENDFDTIVNRLVKVKEVLGDGKSNRSAKIEDMIYDIATDQLLGRKRGGGGGGDEEEVEEEDLGRMVVRELIPTVKKLIEGDVRKAAASGQPVTEEQYRAIVREQATAAAVALEQKLRAQGIYLPGGQPPPGGGGQQIVVNPQATATQPPQQQRRPRSPLEEAIPVNPQPPPPPAPVPQPAPQPAVQTPPPPAPAAAPPNPVQPGGVRGQWDRRESVNYVLRTLWGEIEGGCRPESVAAADALEIWDEELLDAILKVETGEQLETVLKSWADPELWSKISERTKTDETVKIWMRKIVNTVQLEWSRMKREGQAAAPAA